jgi:pimeloyl-ACP methyl ester carboxylesterase
VTFHGHQTETRPTLNIV